MRARRLPARPPSSWRWCLPVVVVFLLGLLQVALVARDQLAIELAAREAARAAAVSAQPAPPPRGPPSGRRRCSRWPSMAEVGPSTVTVTVRHRSRTDVAHRRAADRRRGARGPSDDGARTAMTTAPGRRRARPGERGGQRSPSVRAAVSTTVRPAVPGPGRGAESSERTRPSAVPERSWRSEHDGQAGRARPRPRSGVFERTRPSVPERSWRSEHDGQAGRARPRPRSGVFGASEAVGGSRAFVAQ